MNNIVEIENLTKDYEVGFWRKKKVRALEGLSLNVMPGQIFGFLGGNGAGKTTTIKILMGLLFPTSGTARILGSDISDVAMHKRIGYCPENPYFYDYLTALELMNYFGELFGLNQTERTRRAAELLEKVGLEEKDWSKQLRKFSKGMLQRVGLAQALINEPEIVFFDEPMSGLDPIGRREIRELIV
ncbi:MAG: ABC transporter ATP-binding protein, partial [Pyrinomonadaceae bacterium]